jgi:hypothetical protein
MLSMNSDWNKVRQWTSYYDLRARSATSSQEYISIACDALTEVIQAISLNVTKETADKRNINMNHRKSIDINDEMYAIVTSPIGCYVMAIIVLASLTRQLWILFGLLALIAAKVGGVIAIWLFYILDDPELHQCYLQLRCWMDMLIKEGEDVVNSDAAWKFAMMYTAVSQVPTGLSYIRYIVRYKTRLLRKEFLRELGANRFGSGRKFFAASMVHSSFQSSIQATRLLASHSGSIEVTPEYMDDIWESDGGD